MAAMTREPPAQFDAPPIEAGRQVAHLRHLLAQVSQLAGNLGAASSYDALDEAARISAAYERSLPVAQRRFDTLAEETATWAAVAAEVVKSTPIPAAAAQFARDLEAALRDLGRTVQAG